jgi:hypothetical protein
MFKYMLNKLDDSFIASLKDCLSSSECIERQLDQVHRISTRKKQDPLENKYFINLLIKEFEPAIN